MAAIVALGEGEEVEGVWLEDTGVEDKEAVAEADARGQSES